MKKLNDEELAGVNGGTEYTMSHCNGSIAGIMTVNGEVCIMYSAAAGDELGNIAMDFRVNAGRLASFNGLSVFYIFSASEMLAIPVAYCDA